MNKDITSMQNSTPKGALLNTGQILTGRVPLYKAPDKTSMQVSQLLFGEHYNIYSHSSDNGHEIAMDNIAENWHLVQSKRDGYMGYLNSTETITPLFESNAKVSQLSTALYAAPDMKSPVLRELPFGAELYVVTDNQPNTEYNHDYYFSPPLQAWVYKAHLVLNNQLHTDPVALARQFIGLSYMWGGRSGWGCDCSSLVQLCYELCGCLLPRDTAQQVLHTSAFEKEVITRECIRAADLLFWPGHVAIASSHSTLIHATAFGMQVIEEPIDLVCERIHIAYGTASTILRPRFITG